MSARRPLLTATAAGSVLFALWFVPSANATVEEHQTAAHSQGQPQYHTQSTEDSGTRTAQSEPLAQTQNGSRDLSLADTGSVDTTPYLVGGTVFLGIGAAMVSYAMRRSGSAVL